MNTKLLFIHVLSPLHAGTGQGVGVIDLPIAREKATGIPYLPGASIKGCLRDTMPKTDKDGKAVETDDCHAVFGSPELENAGAAVFTDARLLLLPVRSLAGTFAYVTSPYLLRRLKRDAESAGVPGAPALPDVATVESCLTATSTKLKLGDKVVLEEADLSNTTDREAWAEWLAPLLFTGDWQTFFKERFCIVHDDLLAFLLETATEVVARIKIEDETKTVQKGGLWYEEALPAESVLCSLVSASSSWGKKSLRADEVMQLVRGLLQTESDKTIKLKPIQFGGKASVGRGLCELKLGGA
jgi:CRISPR-associated protein Cmr4